MNQPGPQVNIDVTRHTSYVIRLNANWQISRGCIGMDQSKGHIRKTDEVNVFAPRWIRTHVFNFEHMKIQILFIQVRQFYGRRKKEIYIVRKKVRKKEELTDTKMFTSKVKVDEIETQILESIPSKVQIHNRQKVRKVENY